MACGSSQARVLLPAWSLPRAAQASQGAQDPCQGDPSLVSPKKGQHPALSQVLRTKCTFSPQNQAPFLGAGSKTQLSWLPHPRTLGGPACNSQQPLATPTWLLSPTTCFLSGPDVLSWVHTCGLLPRHHLPGQDLCPLHMPLSTTGLLARRGVLALTGRGTCAPAG